ncbi:transcriptional regulator, TraR/DksA family [Desulfofundulus kuznetsovii DSM 6115]|uniref:Transcriptional regulator, TraR/DksA family n=1 Tax=Desulfofundulus kuznetsovii (strain DSM 6115 / VKM B-1805 / 17) TaxID=760568 RepID=A0AAU8PF01_DESK7|nr:transcriptional regulator, TraR/DksA family [Desulfofundulus kuznetsovii DSM 6115]
MVDAQQLAGIRRRLEEEKQRQLELIKGINEGGLATSMADSIGELSLYDNNPGDIGTEMFERSKDFALREDAKIKIRAIDEALARLDRGTYGTCDICGAAIDPERLEAIPYTTVCYRCRLQDEKRPVSSYRPIEEEIIKNLYQISFEKDMDGVMYDLEDSWQEVARYFEHAGQAEAGAYYGPNELAEEDRGYVEEVENIPYEIGDDGVIYENRRGYDDEGAPSERIDVGIEHSKKEEDSSPYG